MDYFIMLNGPTCTSLVRDFWVRAHVYDKHAAKHEETKKVLIDLSLKEKSREEMGLKLFRCNEIRSSVMGISVFISKDSIAFVIKRAAEGNYKGGIGNPKTSPWNKIVNLSMFNSENKGVYDDLSME
jgi:hypothetical protein